MRAYVGQTRARDLIGLLTRNGVGECVVRGQLPPRRQPYFYDCGAFSDYQAGRDFDGVRYTRDMWRIAYWAMPKPDFIVLPDKVAGGTDSLAMSLDWIDWTEPAGAPMYLALQNGMTPDNIDDFLEGIAGLFVGGTLDWKLRTGAAWTTFAHSRGLKVHIGRVGTVERVEWAARIGVDSIDSSLPLWSADKMQRFLNALRSERAAEPTNAARGLPFAFNPSQRENHA